MGREIVEHSNKAIGHCSERRKRLHELLIALIKQQDDLELMDTERSIMDGGNKSSQELEPAQWLDRNRRVIKRYQSLVLSATTLEALLDAEEVQHERID